MRRRAERSAVSESTAYDLGFRSLTEEVTDRRLPVEGTIPEWLSGALIRNGPGQFDIGGERVTHWFDGLAMLRRYGFEDGEVYYTNRFLRSEAKAAADEGRVTGEFATDDGLIAKAKRWLRNSGPPKPTDNANVHVARIGDEYVALTEAPRWRTFDPVTLETGPEFDWNDDLTEHMTAAHLSVDPGGETFGFGLQFGRSPTYHLYRVPPGSSERERIASVSAEGPGYIHDIAVTRNYLVLVETPLTIGILQALLPWNEGLLDAFTYDETRESRFIIVDRESGDLVAEPTTAPFFTFHHINAYEDGTSLVVDLVTFEDEAILDAMTFDALESGEYTVASDGRYDRFRIDPTTNRIDRDRRYAGGLELPTVPRAVRGRRHRYAYAQATDRAGANGLVKIDADRGTAAEWWGESMYVEELRMIHRPDGDTEDDGVIIAPALDAAAERSVLLVFDAATLDVLARAPLPHALPFGFHGRFFPEIPARLA
ncbi:MAG: carotenoid cleavage dioxygenase-like enzyme [Natronomonas sp.]|jgi:carotenoid cleavage dioxygenase-like enzyme